MYIHRAIPSTLTVSSAPPSCHLVQCYQLHGHSCTSKIPSTRVDVRSIFGAAYARIRVCVHVSARLLTRCHVTRRLLPSGQAACYWLSVLAQSPLSAQSAVPILRCCKHRPRPPLAAADWQWPRLAATAMRCSLVQTAAKLPSAVPLLTILKTHSSTKLPMTRCHGKRSRSAALLQYSRHHRFDALRRC